MRKYYLFFFISVIPFLAFSITDYQIKLIATAYNKGYNHTENYLKNLMEKNFYKYDDSVLINYKYLIGEEKLEKTIIAKSTVTASPVEKPENYDLYYNALVSYIKNIVKNDFDFFYSDIPVLKNEKINFLPIIKKSDLALVKRIDNLLKYYIKNNSSFCKYDNIIFTNNSEKTIDTLKMAKFYVGFSNALKNKIFIRKNFTSYEFFNYFVKIKDIPKELILAIAITESHFYPGTFRPEFNSKNNMYLVSIGLGQTTIDSDNLYFSKFHSNIGNNVKDKYLFDIVSHLYFDDSLSSWDLMTIKGSLTISSIFLQLIYNNLF